MNNSEKHFELAVDLSRDALKSLLLVNGGAATALIALTDKTGCSRDYTTAILLFGAGTVTAVISSCFGYFSQLHYANHRVDDGKTPTSQRSYQLHGRWQKAAIAAVFVTVILMVLGIVAATWVARF